jgi:hypothetical protein
MKDLVPIALVTGGMVEVQQMIVTGPDGHATFQVSDGSTFEVFPNSHVIFRKNAWNPKDLIDLLVGRIRVHIEHLGTLPNPNKVWTPTAVISVRGTTFDVTVGEDDETTTVEVEDGSVEVRHALLPSVTKTLGPGDSIKVYKNEPLQASMWDKGTTWHYALKALTDAANLASMRGGRGILGTSPGGSATSPDKGKGAGPGAGAPLPGAPPPNPGGFVDSGAQDAGGNATGPAAAKHHHVADMIRATAKRSIEWLGRMVGIYPPSFSPIEAHVLF